MWPLFHSGNPAMWGKRSRRRRTSVLTTTTKSMILHRWVSSLNYRISRSLFALPSIFSLILPPFGRHLFHLSSFTTPARPLASSQSKVCTLRELLRAILGMRERSGYIDSNCYNSHYLCITRLFRRCILLRLCFLPQTIEAFIRA